MITEPAVFNTGCILPEPGYLELLREQTRRHGALLIFNEVITGFRFARGGAQEYFGVTPDLTTMAKGLGGGFPVAAIGGSREAMSMIAEGRYSHSGTYNANTDRVRDGERDHGRAGRAWPVRAAARGGRDADERAARAGGRGGPAGHGRGLGTSSRSGSASARSGTGGTHNATPTKSCSPGGGRRCCYGGAVPPQPVREPVPVPGAYREDVKRRSAPRRRRSPLSRQAAGVRLGRGSLGIPGRQGRADFRLLSSCCTEPGPLGSSPTC